MGQIKSLLWIEVNDLTESSTLYELFGHFGQCNHTSVECASKFLAIEKEHALRALQCVDGPIAQSVEQLAFNQWVAGSSPARLTNKIK